MEPSEKKHETPKPRPALFRALGNEEAPEVIILEGRKYRLREVFKHDSWAATALYVSHSDKVVCKFNRKNPILGIPMVWLGRMIARREAFFFAELSDVPEIPKGYATVFVDGNRWETAFAHQYVEGRSINESDRLQDEIFDRVADLLERLHRRGIAYMDLHKPENLILGDDGRIHLVDFQVSFVVRPDSWCLPLRWLLRLFQQGDEYHLLKHRTRLCLNPPKNWKEIMNRHRPWWLKLHRGVAVPLRTLRRKFLTLLGIRRGTGRADTEHFVEIGLRPIFKDFHDGSREG